jgi:hypothetical protein
MVDTTFPGGFEVTLAWLAVPKNKTVGFVLFGCLQILAIKVSVWLRKAGGLMG